MIIHIEYINLRDNNSLILLILNIFVFFILFGMIIAHNIYIIEFKNIIYYIIHII